MNSFPDKWFRFLQIKCLETVQLDYLILSAPDLKDLFHSYIYKLAYSYILIVSRTGYATD